MNFSIDRWKIIHISIGGIIFFASIILFGFIAQAMLDLAFRTLGIWGVLAYAEAQNAHYIIRLGTDYLTAGFFGGLYIGYKVKEHLKAAALFPAPFGLTVFFAVQYFLGYGIPPSSLTLINLLKIIVAPLMISIAGSYMGIYTVNWRVEEKPKEERISFIS